MLFFRLAFLTLIPFSRAGQVWKSESLLAVIQIQQTLSLFPLAVDDHNYTILNQVFAANATANFATFAEYLQGLPAIKKGLRDSLANSTSQHALTTQSIDVFEDRKASAVTYITGTFFGQGPYAGQIFTTYGRYLDDLIYLQQEGWRVTKKTLVVTGQIGNPQAIGLGVKKT